MIGHGRSSAGSYLADPTSPIPSHCASIVATSILRLNFLQVNLQSFNMIFDLATITYEISTCNSGIFATNDALFVVSYIHCGITQQINHVTVCMCYMDQDKIQQVHSNFACTCTLLHKYSLISSTQKTWMCW